MESDVTTFEVVVPKDKIKANLLFNKGVKHFPIIKNIITNEEKNLNYKETNVGSSVDWWRMRSHDPQRTGFSSSIAPNTNHISWSYSTGNAIDLSSAAIVENKIYIGTMGSYFKGESMFKMLSLEDRLTSQKPSFSLNFYKNQGSNPTGQSGQVLCLDSNNGDFKWSTSVSGYVESSPVVVDEKVYLTTTDEFLETGRVYCLNAITGDIYWEHSIGSPLFSSPVVYDGKVFITVLEWEYFSGKIICYDADNGNLIWSHPMSAFEYSWLSSPVAADEKVFISSFNELTFEGRVHCYNAEDGGIVWSNSYYNTMPDIATSAYMDDKLYVPLLDFNIGKGKLMCFNANDGGDIWSYYFGDQEYCMVSSPSFGYGNVYVATNDDMYYSGSVYCLNALDADLIWSKTVNDWPFTSPVVADEKIYVAYEYEGLICYDAFLGDFLWYSSIGSCYSSPAVAKECLYIASFDGVIYAFEDQLKIEKIMGGILNTKIKITNDGDIELNNISWTISVTGGSYIPVDKYAEGTISSLDAGESKFKIAFPVFGLGKIEIQATATLPNLNVIKKKVDGFALGPIIIALK